MADNTWMWVAGGLAAYFYLKNKQDKDKDEKEFVTRTSTVSLTDAGTNVREQREASHSLKQEQIRMQTSAVDVEARTLENEYQDMKHEDLMIYLEQQEARVHQLFLQGRDEEARMLLAELQDIARQAGL